MRILMLNSMNIQHKCVNTWWHIYRMKPEEWDERILHRTSICVPFEVTKVVKV